MPGDALGCFGVLSWRKDHGAPQCHHLLSEELTGASPPCYRVLHREVDCDAPSMALEDGGHGGSAILGDGLARALTPFIYPCAPTTLGSTCNAFCLSSPLIKGLGPNWTLEGVRAAGAERLLPPSRRCTTHNLLHIILTAELFVCVQYLRALLKPFGTRKNNYEPHPLERLASRLVYK